MAAGTSESQGSRLLRSLKSHPILCLLLLTPGIPEYLSSSSPINALVLNPFQFAFQLLANLGLYGSGALLIHDAKVRWNKGWATVLLLGFAYGILEEGVALSTMFNPNAGPVGSLGAYGHWLGVNWVWSAGIVPFHALWSISIPILLLGLSVSETKTRRLLSRRGTMATIMILGADVLFLMVIVNHATGYWMGYPILLGSALSIAALVWAARRASPAALLPPSDSPKASGRKVLAIGVSFFPAILLSQSLGEGAGVPAAVDFVLVILIQAAYLWYLARQGWRDNERGKLALSLGLLIPIMVFGVVAELSLPMTLLADVVVVLFFRRLWAAYSPKTNESLTVS